MGVTAYLTTDLASIPLMWIIPLALYLLSFILAFSAHAIAIVRSREPAAALSDRAPGAGHERRVCSPIVDSPASARVFRRVAGMPWCAGPHASAGAALVVVLRDHRPGGAMGGIWTALVAPLVFDRVVEYPLAMVLACLVAPGFAVRHDRTKQKGPNVGPAVRGSRVLV